MKNHNSIEPLEARIAPAAMFTYTEPDGDVVTVKTSRGTDAQLAPLLNFDTPAAATKTLRRLDLSSMPVVFEGTDISIAVTTRGPAGDGLVRVGDIRALMMDLGKVTVKGDLGGLDCGNPGHIGPAAKSLTVHSMGVSGTAIQVTPDLTSSLVGSLGKLTVAGDLTNNIIIEITGAGSTLGPVKIGGSMNGGAVSVEGGIASFTLRNDMRGGGLIRSVTGDIGAVRIGGDVFAIDSAPSGGILADAGNIKSVFIGGNVTSGRGITGGGINGGVFAGGRIGSVFIGGDVIVDGSFNINNTASHITGVRAGRDIGAVTIRGDVSGAGFEKVEITAYKNLNPAIPLAIKSVTVGGNVSAFEMNAGYPLAGGGTPSADVHIGKVTVGGSWIFSTIRAGVGGPTFNVGVGNDVLLAGDTPGIISRIVSVTIKGTVLGAPFHPTALLAEDIGSLSIGGSKVPLKKFGDIEDRFVLGNSGNFRIYEV